jgi:hypothetical protein
LGVYKFFRLINFLVEEEDLMELDTRLMRASSGSFLFKDLLDLSVSEKLKYLNKLNKVIQEEHEHLMAATLGRR